MRCAIHTRIRKILTCIYRRAPLSASKCTDISSCRCNIRARAYVCAWVCACVRAHVSEYVCVYAFSCLSAMMYLRARIISA